MVPACIARMGMLTLSVAAHIRLRKSARDSGQYCAPCRRKRKRLQGPQLFIGSVVRILFLIFLCTGVHLHAQYRYDVWTADNGLPQNIVRGIYQAPGGFLWIATFDGLVRFDGIRFTVFNKSNTPGVDSNRIVSMYGTPSGDLWLNSEGGGLTRYHNGAFQNLGPNQGIDAKTVRGVTGDAAGHIWILNADAIEEWDAGREQFHEITPAGPHLKYESLSWANQGFWGWDGQGIHCFIQGRFFQYPYPRGMTANTIMAVAHEHDGTIWVETTDRKYFRIGPGQPGVRVSNPAITYVDRAGHSWNLRIGHELYRSVDYPNSGQISTIKFASMYEDREGDLWFGTDGEGLYRLQRQSISVYTKQPGLPDDNIYPIFQDHAGAIWIGAWRAGLSRFSDGKFTNFSVADGVPGRLVTSIYEDREGRLWVAAHGGVSVYEKGHFRRPAQLTLPERSVVQAMFEDNAGTLWFGTSRGLVSFDGNRSRLFNVQDGLASDDVRVIIEGRAGDLWIGGYGGLSRMRDGQFARWNEKNGLPSNNIRCLYEDRDGVIWVGTYDGGLGRLKNDVFSRFTTREGLFNNGVFQILEDDRGNLWVSCNRGIFRVNKKQLNDVADGKRKVISSVAYGKVDGMANVECNGGHWPAGIKARDGKMWFPTQQGIAVIDPEAVLYNPQPPPVVIESLSEDRMPVFLKGARIPPHTENIEIQYTAPSFIKPEQIHFKYWLEGLDSNWIDAGARRTAYYSHLPPGQYSFHVIAGNSDGVWNETGAITTFTVLPAYYQTAWFRLLCYAIFALLLWSFFRLRLRQVAARMQTRLEERLAERERMARDLHDTLLQGFVSAYMQLDVANDRLPLDSPAKPLVQRVLDLMKQVSEEGRNTIRSLRSSDPEGNDLEQVLSRLQEEFTTQKPVDFRVIVEGKPKALHPVIRDEVCRIAREAIINAFRHANATSIEVGIEYAARRLGLTVRDNGCGIDSKLLQTGREGHWGLSNMRERAEKIGAKLSVLSRPGAGTEVQLSVPDKVAFGTTMFEHWRRRLTRWFDAKPTSDTPVVRQ